MAEIIGLFNPELRISVEDGLTVDEAVVESARKWELYPISVPLFGLCTWNNGKWHWYAPHERLRDLRASEGIRAFSFRLRFKVPSPDRLLGIDRGAFRYFYLQVRKDFVNGLVTSYSSGSGCSGSSGQKDIKMWLPVVDSGGGKDSELTERYTNISRLMALNMIIDIKEQKCNAKDVVKNIKAHFPKDIWANTLDKLMGPKRLVDNVEKLINHWLERPITGAFLKLEFLNLVEQHFPRYFDENFSHIVNEISSSESVQVRLTFRPPFRSCIPPFPERDPVLVMKRNKYREEAETVICTVEEICNISLNKGERKLEISRKNGIPVYLSFSKDRDVLNFLSLLCGYYRLCERWTFTLCHEISYPTLEKLRKCHVHGPVPADFVEKKFAEKAQNVVGSFILRQSPQTYDLYYIHFISSKPTRREMCEIIFENGKYSLKNARVELIPEGKESSFGDLLDLIKALKSPECPFPLTKCLHPSEFDKDPLLLLCRSNKQLEMDLISGNDGSSGHQNAVFIPFYSLSKYESECYQGSVTNVWKGQWTKSKNEKVLVAIKQLKAEFETEYLRTFSNMANKTMLCRDSTIVECFGFCPSFKNEPMAIILEYFPLGPLDLYLKSHKTEMDMVDLLEAAACLARALWYMNGEKQLIHGKIRCSSVFVYQHNENAFKVKLGDSRLRRQYSLEEDVHWLPTEVLQMPVLEVTSPSDDVWAYATTLWEIFSFGEQPQPGIPGEAAKLLYLRGDRLQPPIKLQESKQISDVYELMCKCWNPDPTFRESPQEIMRDMNQIFYKAYNARHVHNYVTIKDDFSSPARSASPSSVSSSSSSTYTVVESETLVPMLPSNSSSTSELNDFSGFGNRNAQLIPIFKDMMDRAFRRNGGQGEFGSSSECLINGPGSSSSSYSVSMKSFDTSVYQLSSANSQYSSIMPCIYDLDESRLEYNKNLPLGEGNFGVVYRGGFLRSDGIWEDVAVKMLKGSTEDMSPTAFDELNKELEIMRQLSHENIVKIKATTHNSARNVIIIMEYMKEGSLDQYLNRHQASIRRDHGKRLFKYALDIVEGMAYLSRHNIIHRDLAARNILVANEETVKISDFGLARETSDDYYIMSSSTDIPAKWLAIECLTKHKYSSASDVWSFGVTLWEMFSYGETPFLEGCEGFFKPGNHRDLEIWITRLDKGQRLPRTPDCPLTVYKELMLPCWLPDPKARPTFDELYGLIPHVELQVT